MKTSCFSRYLSTGRISIARYAPRNTPAGYRMYKPLARGAGFNSVSTSRYIELYESEVLGRPDARQVWNELHAMAGGQEPVLLCREKPGEFCHRQLVARWFRRELNILVDEYDPRATGQIDLL